MIGYWIVVAMVGCAALSVVAGSSIILPESARPARSRRSSRRIVIAAIGASDVTGEGATDPEHDNWIAQLSTRLPEDVDVQVVHGRIGNDDNLVDTTSESLVHAETYEAGRHRFEGQVALTSTGPFGYTVRVLPKNQHLAGPAELGRVTYPPA